MGHIVEKKLDEVVDSVLQTTEKSFTSLKEEDRTVSAKLSAKASAEVISEASEKVYFQIED